MATFSDDFSTNTLDEYDVTQGGSSAGAGDVAWDSDGELLDIHAPNNVTVFLSRDDVGFTETGRVRMEFVVHGDYHVTDEVGVRWRQDDDNWLDWRGTGDGSDSRFAASYGDQVRAQLGGETVAHERRVPGTVGPGPNVRTLEATWNPSGMAVAIDGEEAATVDVDLSDFSPTTISFLVNQGDVDLKSVEVLGGAPDSEPERVTVDDFEDGDVAEYEPRYARPSLAAATFDAVSGSLTGSGSMMLRAHRPDGEGQNPRIQSVSGLDYYPSRGDTIEFYTQYNHSQHTPAFYFGVQSVDETDLYFVQYDSRADVNPQNPDSLVLNRRVDGTTTRLAKVSAPFSNHANETLRCVIEWADPIEVAFYDSNDDLIAELSASDDTFSEGGIGFGIRGHYRRSDTVYWDRVTAIPGGGQEPEEPERVEASVTTLQFIPGRNENVTQGGYPLNSGLMQIFGETDTIDVDRWNIHDLAVDPVLDSWLKGDMTFAAKPEYNFPGNDELPFRLEDALKEIPDKYSDEFPEEAFHSYRFHNGITVGFETTDGETIEQDSVEIEFAEDGRTPNDPIVSLGGRGNSNSVLVKHEVNGIPVDEWYDNEYARTSNRTRRYYRYNTKFEFDGVEGVRVTTVAGGWAGFVEDLSNRVGNDVIAFFHEVWDWDIPLWLARLAYLYLPVGTRLLTDYLVRVPNNYTFLDFIVLADGRRYVRVWDASEYPSLATYVDGRREHKKKMPYEPRELFNGPMLKFHIRATAGVTPFTSPLGFYERVLDDSELLEALIGDAMDELPPPIGFATSEVVPNLPIVTLGFHDEDGSEAIDDPDAPYDELIQGLLYPVSGEIVPK